MSRRDSPADRNLLKQFPTAPFVAKVDVWTQDRNKIEVRGPTSEVAGELLIQVACRHHPEGKSLAAMEECLAKLREVSNGAGK